MNFFSELKRRNVLRAALLYAGAVWALAQGIAQLSPVVGAPEWVARWFLVAAAVGFPFWVAFAWFYEFTPTGLKRESEIAPDDSIAHSTGRKLDKWIIAVLAVAVVLLLTNTFVWRKGVQTPTAEAVNGTPAAIPAKSIAVLPFVNMSGDPKQDYFSDGITEEILNALAQVPGLKVAARTSAFEFKGKAEDLRKVGDTLGVATVLEGSVQTAGDEVRITAQLIDTRTGYHLWSQKYDRKLSNVFAVEDDISNAIADKLRLQLTGDNGSVLVAQQAVDARAHDFYLRGLGLLAARGPGLREAETAFQNAVKIAPRYADAWGALAETELALPGYVLSVSRDVATTRAEAAAQTALSINPNTVSALVAMAGVHAYRLQWQQAQDSYEHAITLAPGDAEAADQYAQYLFATGQLDPALQQINRAQQMDPLSAIIGVVRSGILMALRRDADATAQIERVLSAHPDFYPANVTAVALYVGRGRFADAEQQMRTMAANFGVDADAKVILVRGIVEPALRAAALASLKSATANADIRADQVLSSMFLAMLGDRDDAIAQLDDYASQRNAAALGMVWTRPFDPLRDDPRFNAVLKKMGLPYTPLATHAP